MFVRKDGGDRPRRATGRLGDRQGIVALGKQPLNQLDYRRGDDHESTATDENTDERRITSRVANLPHGRLRRPRQIALCLAQPDSTCRRTASARPKSVFHPCSIRGRFPWATSPQAAFAVVDVDVELIVGSVRPLAMAWLQMLLKNA
jgi:hypothetical protein